MAGVFGAWHGRKDADDYADEPGFCASVGSETIAQHEFVLTPGRYCGSMLEDDEDGPFEERYVMLMSRLDEQFELSRDLQERVRSGLGEITRAVRRNHLHDDPEVLPRREG